MKPDPPLVRVERTVSASPETVWRYLTESEAWARWQGEEATIDARAGGIFRMRMGTGQTARGEFVELDPPHRVVFTWGWIDHPGVPPGSTRVEIELLAVPEGTRIVLTHHDLPEEERELHTVGWKHYLPRLAEASEGRDPGIDPGPGGT